MAHHLIDDPPGDAGVLQFVLLRRNPERVAIAGGLLSVMPTGVFQPACILSTEDCPDFDL
jgi:hypothetical protein